MPLLARILPEQVPELQLPCPGRPPSYCDTDSYGHWQTLYWEPSPLRAGKVELVQRHRREQSDGAVPKLTHETRTFIDTYTSSPKLRAYYRAIGMHAAMQTTTHGKITLYEVIIPSADTVNRQLDKLGSIGLHVCTTPYTDAIFLHKLKAATPKVALATTRDDAACHLLTRIGPAWGFTPPEAIEGLGDYARSKLKQGIATRTLAERIHATMNNFAYGRYIAQAVEEEQSPEDTHSNSWRLAAHSLNCLAEAEIATPHTIAHYVGTVLRIAQNTNPPRQ